MLLTMEADAKVEARSFPNPERIDKVYTLSMTIVILSFKHSHRYPRTVGCCHGYVKYEVKFVTYFLLLG